MILSRWAREVGGKWLRRGSQDGRHESADRAAPIRPVLEHLEDRLAPTNFLTSTDVAINITPNFLSRTAVETITATVTQQGTTTPVQGGNINFNVNNQQGTVPLNSKGQATFTTTLPLFAVANNQTLLASFDGATIGSDTFSSSAFLSPVYLNMLNALLPSQITFGAPPNTMSPTTPFNSAGGEKDAVSLFFLPVDFNYVDPGRIDTFSIDGITLPGSFATIFGIQQLG